jgi:hypothetical protein
LLRKEQVILTVEADGVTRHAVIRFRVWIDQFA